MAQAAWIQLRIEVHKACIFALFETKKTNKITRRKHSKEGVLDRYNKRFGFAGKAISSVQNSGNPNIFIGTAALAY